MNAWMNGILPHLQIFVPKWIPNDWSMNWKIERNQKYLPTITVMKTRKGMAMGANVEFSIKGYGLTIHIHPTSRVQTLLENLVLALFCISGGLFGVAQVWAFLPGGRASLPALGTAMILGMIPGFVISLVLNAWLVPFLMKGAFPKAYRASEKVALNLHGYVKLFMGHMLDDQND